MRFALDYARPRNKKKLPRSNMHRPDIEFATHMEY